MLNLNQIHVAVDGKLVISGVDLNLDSRKIHALMGPNGSGKSSLAQALMGHPLYSITAGSVTLDGESLLSLSPDQRAHLGLFLAFQYPVTIPGVSVQNTLKSAYEAIHCTGCTLHTHCPKLSVTEFRQNLTQTASLLGIEPSFLTRSLNDGFSGGEKKRVEMLTLLTLKPKFAILDETDSGLDIDSIKLVAKAINYSVKQDHVGILLITHYRRILDYVPPDHVSVMVKGKLVATDGPKLIDQIEAYGYKHFKS